MQQSVNMLLNSIFHPNPSFLIWLFSQALLLLDRKKLIFLVLTLTLKFIFEKRAANFIQRYKIAYFYVKIGLWILTSNFTNKAFLKYYRVTYIHINGHLITNVIKRGGLGDRFKLDSTN